MDTVTLEHTVKTHESNTRLDALVFGLLPSGSVTGRGAVTRAVRSGGIIVNGSTVKPTYRVKTGDRVIGKLGRTPAADTLRPDPTVPITIVFENEDLLIIDKPAGVLTHPAQADKTGTVANWAVAHDPRIADSGEDPLRPGIVHRLDRDTSGLLIIAKAKRPFLELKSAFKRHAVRKTYLALVHGRPMPETGSIDIPIARALRGDRQTSVIPERKTIGKVRPAVTEYAVVRQFGDYSLVETYPKTGRTHQIRVHLASIGHPVVGDRLYGTKATRAEARELPRHLLHATRLEFSLSDKRYTFDSPLPEDWLTQVHGIQKAS